MNKLIAALVAGLFATSVFAQAVSLTTPPVVAKAEAKADAANVKAASAETKADIKD
jgi:hypothetical protein